MWSYKSIIAMAIFPINCSFKPKSCVATYIASCLAIRKSSHSGTFSEQFAFWKLMIDSLKLHHMRSQWWNLSSYLLALLIACLIHYNLYGWKIFSANEHYIKHLNDLLVLSEYTIQVLYNHKAIPIWYYVARAKYFF